MFVTFYFTSSSSIDIEAEMFLFDDVFSFVKIPEELISQYAAAGRWEIYRSITVDINIDS